MEADNLPDGEFNYYGCKDFQRTWGRLMDRVRSQKFLTKRKYEAPLNRDEEYKN